MKAFIDSLLKHYSGNAPLFLLGSQLAGHKASRYTYLAAEPEAIIKAKGCEIETVEEGKVSRFKANPWQALGEFRKKRNDYLFGYLGYDLKNHIERLQSNNHDKIGAPDLFFMAPSVLVKIDEERKKAEAIKGRFPKALHESEGCNKLRLSKIHSSINRKDYISKTEQVKNDIYEGKYYELNFTHQLTGGFSGIPYQLYQKMRQNGPVPFGAYAKFDGLALCCSSPERFLSKKGRKVFSQPIKGTIKRASTKKEDEALRNALKQSAKERAENMMIVDLVRNDLSRIAHEGSVEVRNLFEIQSFSTVHQMVSTVIADAKEKDPVEIIKACFPPGSMTGAPKVSVMKSIEKLENYKRGIYSGAIGYITPNGNFDFNVVIRTAIIKGNELFYAAGGAITADSDPQAEWEESWLKAKAITDFIDNADNDH